MPDNRVRVGGILQRRDLCLIGVMGAPDRPGIGAAIFDALGLARLNAQFIVQCIDLSGMSHVLFCVADEDAERALQVVQPVVLALEARAAERVNHVALLSVFGPDFRERSGIAGPVFRALASRGINILAISTSISTVTCVILESDMEGGVAALHEAVQLP